jgi:hypothetical protein
MNNCELLDGGLFFKDQMPMEYGLGSLYKKKYCLGDNTMCARFMVAKVLGREKVPTDLYPNMHDRARELIPSG